MKKRLLIILSFIVVGMLSVAQAQQINQIRIGLAAANLDDPINRAIADSAQIAADSLGVELIIMDAGGSADQQFLDVRTLLVRQIDVLLIVPIDSVEIVPAVEAANIVGIPVIAVDQEISDGEIAGQILSDDIRGGELAARFLCEQLDGEGSVIELRGSARSSAARDRSLGFNGTLTRECPGINVVSRTRADYDRELAEVLLFGLIQGRLNIDAVFAHSDAMVFGAIDAAERQDEAENIVFVGFGGTDEAIVNVFNGALDATIATQPAVMGALAVESAFTLVNGGTIQPVVTVDVSLVSAAEVAPAPETFTNTDSVTIGLSLSTMDNPFFLSLRDGAQLSADTLGVNLIVMDAANDPALEAQNITDMIAQDVDALIVNSTDANAVSASIQAANSAGIPVYTVDRSAASGDVTSHIASDNVTGGSLAAAFICQQLNGEGMVVELQGIQGTSAARDRGTGFNTYLTEQCPGVTVIQRARADFNRERAVTVFGAIMVEWPEIDAVFAHNDEMILGAREAAQSVNRAEQTVFVGFDGTDDALVAVNAGTLAATIAQQPSLMGALAVEAAIRGLNGEPVEPFIPVELALVTGEM